MTAETGWTPEEEEQHVRGLMRRLGPEVAELVVNATACGWKAIVGKTSVTIVSPNQKHRIHFGGRKRLNMQKTANEVMKHGDPGLVKSIKALATDRNITPDMFEAAIEAASSMGEFTLDLPPKPQPRREQKVTPERKIIRQGPMLAKASQGQAYDSEVSIERHWSDGTTDYACSYPQCDYTTEKRLSVRGHWQVHVKAGEVARVERGPTKEADVPLAVVYSPRQTRIDALAAFLATLGQVGIDDLAKAALTWVHEQSRTRSEHAAEYDVPDDGDILNRIRALIGKDDAQRAASLEQEVERLTEALEAQKEHTEKVAGDLRTLKELVAGMGD